MALNVVMPAPGYTAMRRWPRYRLDVPVRVIVDREDRVAIVPARGIDLNEGGLAVFAGTELAIEQVILIEFTPPYSGQPIRVRCTVRNRQGYRYGLEFSTATSADQLAADAIRAALAGLGRIADF